MSSRSRLESGLGPVGGILRREADGAGLWMYRIEGWYDPRSDECFYQRPIRENGCPGAGCVPSEGPQSYHRDRRGPERQEAASWIREQLAESSDIERSTLQRLWPGSQNAFSRALNDLSEDGLIKVIDIPGAENNRKHIVLRKKKADTPDELTN